MIYVTLGSQKFPFDRLLQALDKQVAEGLIDAQIVAQTGYSTYQPQHYEHKDFFDKKEYSALIDKADIVITHGGTGAIIESVKKHKKVIAVPRLSSYGEHVDDHQLQICQMFRELGLILDCEDTDELPELIKKAKGMTFKSYQSNTQTILDSIEEYIESLK